MDTETGELDHRQSLTQSRYCPGRVYDKRREILGQIPERSSQGSRGWAEGREKGPNLETNDRQREETYGGLLPMPTGHRVCGTAVPARRTEEEAQWGAQLPDLRKPQQPELRQCWDAGCEVGREEPEKALEES